MYIIFIFYLKSSFYIIFLVSHDISLTIKIGQFQRILIFFIFFFRKSPPSISHFDLVVCSFRTFFPVIYSFPFTIFQYTDFPVLFNPHFWILTFTRYLLAVFLFSLSCLYIRIFPEFLIILFLHFSNFFIQKFYLFFSLHFKLFI